MLIHLLSSIGFMSRRGNSWVSFILHNWSCFCISWMMLKLNNISSNFTLLFFPILVFVFIFEESQMPMNIDRIAISICSSKDRLYSIARCWVRPSSTSPSPSILWIYYSFYLQPNLILFFIFTLFSGCLCSRHVGLCHFSFARW